MSKWVTSAAFAQRELAVAISPNVAECTVKATIVSGLAGSAFRFVFAEDYGKAPAQYVGAAAEVKGQKVRITVAGEKSFTVAPGQQVVSDPVALPVAAGDAITLWLSMGASPSLSETTLEQKHTIKGDYCWEGFEAVPYQCPLPGAPFTERLCGLKELQVEVEDTAAVASIAVFGDSIAESAVWIDPLQKKLQAENGNVTLLNLGIGGNRLLHDTNVPMMMGVNAFGKAGLKRLDSDILSLSGVKAVIVAMGINDISQPGGMPAFSPPVSELCSVEELKAGLEEVVDKCHEKGLAVIGATITPFKGFSTYHDTTAKLRSEINEWIMTGGAFDATIDLGKLLGSPEDGEAMPDNWQVGDHLHPNPVGGAAAAEQIDVQQLLSLMG